MSTAADVIEGRARWCVERARAEAFADALPDGCVNLLWLDVPYFRAVNEAWDRAWPDAAAYLAWLDGCAAQWARVLAPNGSIYVCASPTMAARVEVTLAKRFRVLNTITWNKAIDYPPGDPRGTTVRVRDVAQARTWLDYSERVVFAEHWTTPMSLTAAAVATARTRAGLSRGAVAVAIGRTRAGDPTRDTGLVNRWEEGACEPSADDYVAALRFCGDPRSDLALRADHADLVTRHHATRRPFDAIAATHTTDVWTYETVPSYPGKHPCEKPAEMVRDVVLTSSRPGDVVADFFGGSFRMAEAALTAGRRFLGCDADPHWASVGQARARSATDGTVPAVAARPRAPQADSRQQSLFKGEP